MHDIGFERREIPLCGGRHAQGHAIFCASQRQGDGAHAHQITGGREGGCVGRGGVDADVDLLAQQIADQTVERLIGAVAHIIIIAAEHGDAEAR